MVIFIRVLYEYCMYSQCRTAKENQEKSAKSALASTEQQLTLSNKDKERIIAELRSVRKQIETIEAGREGVRKELSDTRQKLLQAHTVLLNGC